MRNVQTTDDLEQLKQQLQRVRAESLAAVRRNDFRAVARLTAETARINRAIHTAEDFSDCAEDAQRLVEALADSDSSSQFVFPDLPADQPTQVWQDAA
jgi:hypothetical protein